MAERVDAANVHLWGRHVGAVAWDPDRSLAYFEYSEEYTRGGMEPAPFTMPAAGSAHTIYSFPELPRSTFRGLPGMLADSLPDRFGETIIEAWLAREGRDRMSFTPVEQLCYVGRRGMGALEFTPAIGGVRRTQTVTVDALADLAGEVLRSRTALRSTIDDEGLEELLRVGTSAGGARAKAVIAWKPSSGEVRSGQVDVPAGFEYWIVKFDGVGGGDHGLADPEGYGRIEYAYSLMARDCGIAMAPTRLEVDRSGRAHFMTKRFDRTDDGGKLHMQSLSALRHFDFNQAGRHAYEDAFSTALGLDLGAPAVAQLFRRMVFNVVARNQDDHTKNIAFLMDRNGEWSLTPAFDVTWAFNPSGEWTSSHQMTVNGKRDGFVREDLTEVGEAFSVHAPSAIIEEIVDVVAAWPRYAAEGGVEDDRVVRIASTHRLDL